MFMILTEKNINEKLIYWSDEVLASLFLLFEKEDD